MRGRREPAQRNQLGGRTCQNSRKPPGKEQLNGALMAAAPVLDQNSSSSLMLLLPLCGFYMLLALKRRLSLQRANPGVTGVEGGPWQHMCESFNCGWRCLVLLAQHFLNAVQKSFQSAVILHSTPIFSIMGGGEKKTF